MRALGLILVLAPWPTQGADEVAATIRQKLQAKILESAPPPAPEKAATEKKETTAPPVVMKPVIISDSRLIQAVTETLEREERNRREERFDPVSGGKIVDLGFAKLGSWWSLSEGWTFLRMNQAPTRRQVEAAETRMKELQELLTIGEKPGRPAKP